MEKSGFYIRNELRVREKYQKCLDKKSQPANAQILIVSQFT